MDNSTISATISGSGRIVSISQFVYRIEATHSWLQILAIPHFCFSTSCDRAFLISAHVATTEQEKLMSMATTPEVPLRR